DRNDMIRMFGGIFEFPKINLPIDKFKIFRKTYKNKVVDGQHCTDMTASQTYRNYTRKTAKHIAYDSFSISYNVFLSPKIVEEFIKRRRRQPFNYILLR